MKITAVIITIVICLASVERQQNQRSQAEQVVLDTPEVISLKLTPLTRRASASVSQQVTGPFTPESKIKFALVATNGSLLPLVVRTWDHLDQNRPRLVRDNQEVGYRAGLNELIKKKDEQGATDIISLVSVTLEPNQEKTLEFIDLGEWYTPLQPGHYVLSTQHRFIQGGKGVDAASVTFEVEKKKQ